MPWKSLPKILLLAALVTAAWWFGPWRSLSHPAGILVPNSPVQTEVRPFSLPEISGWKLQAFAEYRLQGRVLGTKRYHDGPPADLVPIDVAVSWGKMSDTAVLEYLDLSMGNRFFFYEYETHPPITPKDLERSAANNHVIAANDTVRKVIRNLRKGHLVELHGYLVNANRPGGGAWKSSRRRDDTGNGACELFYVESARTWETPPPEFAAKVANQHSSITPIAPAAAIR